MSFQSSIENKIAYITIASSRLDASISPELKAEVANALDKGAETVVIDLASVEFMDSSGLGAVIGSFKLAGRDRQFVLCNLQESVQEVFKLTHMDKVFDINESLADVSARLAA